MAEKIILTFDLEYWFESLSIQKYLSGNEEDALESFVNRVLSLLASTNSTATFFVTGKVLDSEPDLIQKIFGAGHEIAIHSIDHKPLWRKNPAQFDAEIKEMAAKIEKVTGKRPIGHRAANFSLNKKTIWALKILANNQLKYDSSIFLARLLSSPLSEIPVFGGGIYIRFIPWLIFKILLKNKLKKEAACLYFHPFDFSKKYPDIKMPKFKKLIKYFNTKNTWPKLEYIIKNFECVSVKKYLLF